ncbi:hypothetical protein COOONC_07273, partial [Cooperia oncophora]
MVHKMNGDTQKSLALSTWADKSGCQATTLRTQDSQRKISLYDRQATIQQRRDRQRKTSLYDNYPDVIVEPFPALPINVRLPSLRGSSTQHSIRRSTTDVRKQSVAGEDRLKQWANLDVLPDTDATAALAQLALHQTEPPDPKGIGKEESHDATKTLSTPPTTPPPTTFTTTLLMPPSTCPAGTARKLTPMPRDLHPPHHTKP